MVLGQSVLPSHCLYGGGCATPLAACVCAVPCITASLSPSNTLLAHECACDCTKLAQTHRAPASSLWRSTAHDTRTQHSSRPCGAANAIPHRHSAQAQLRNTKG